MYSLWDKLLIAVWNGVLSAICLVKKSNESIALSMKWAQNLSKSLDWIKTTEASMKK